ncbi:MAG: DUF1513 domain-containing protein [Rhodovibrionaceae bacterium]
MEIDRRTLLALLAGGAAWPLWPARLRAAAQQGHKRLYLSARAAEDGSFRISGFSETGAPAFDLALPGRGHSLAVRPSGGEAVFFARRPGAFAKVVDLRGGKLLREIAAPEDRHFYGHGVFSAGGRMLYAPENDFAAGRGVLGVYDATAGYARVGELPSHGAGPHDVKLLSDGTTLAVANGGIQTRPDLPRVKLNVPTMAPSLAYIDRRDGSLLQEVKLAPELHQLSIRHLALGAEDRVAVAMQYEGPKGDTVPLVFTHRGREQAQILDDMPSVTKAMDHYCGSTVFDVEGRVLAVSSPRGGLVAFWDVSAGKFLSKIEFPDVCGIAPAGKPGSFIASSGRGGALEVDARRGSSRRIVSDFLESARWDNHMAAVEI